MNEWKITFCWGFLIIITSSKTPPHPWPRDSRGRGHVQTLGPWGRYPASSSWRDSHPCTSRYVFRCQGYNQGSKPNILTTTPFIAPPPCTCHYTQTCIHTRIDHMTRISKNDMTAFCWSSSDWLFSFFRRGCLMGSYSYKHKQTQLEMQSFSTVTVSKIASWFYDPLPLIIW